MSSKIKDPSEDQIHRQVVAWAALQSGGIPELNLLFHPPNGGHRHKATAAKMKAMGAKAGVPDLCLAVQRGEYGALYVELKTKTGRLRTSQKQWRDRLQEHGQAWALCRSFDDARSCIMDYLDGSFRPDLYAE